MKIPSNILHDKQYADKILEITADTMFFVYKDGTCLDFKANTTDFFIKEQDIIGRNIFSYFPVETAREMYAEFIKVRAGDKPSARNYKLILEDDVKYYKCIISKYDEEHFLFQYRDITGRSVVRLKLEKKQKDLCEVEKAARIGLWDLPRFLRRHDRRKGDAQRLRIRFLCSRMRILRLGIRFVHTALHLLGIHPDIL